MYSKTGNNYKGAGRRVISLVLAIALICSFGLTSVFANGGAQANDSGIKSVTVTGDTNIKVGETTQLTKEVIRDSGSTATKTVTWSSDKTDIATVSDNGLVTATAVGTATITATSTANTGVSGTVAITVTAATDPTPPAGEPDKKALQTLITTANEERSGISFSNDGTNIKTSKKWATPANHDTFNTAIRAAETVRDKNNATQGDVAAAVTALTAAHKTFMGQVEDGKKMPTGIEVTVRYPNSNGYVSIDTKDTAKASDYFNVIVNDSEWDYYELTSAAFATTEKLSEVLKVSKPGYQNNNGTLVRFVPIGGEALTDGVYNVAMTGVVKVGDKNTVNVKFNVELHISATDPAYLTVDRAIFNVADLNTTAKELISEPVTIKVPSGNAISEVIIANAKETGYSIVDGKWDSAKKEYSFKLKAVADADGKYNLGFRAEILAKFANSKARMAFASAEVEVAVRTTDDKLKDYVKLEPDEPLMVGNRASIEVKETDKLPQERFIEGDVKKISNFISTPAGALENYGSSWIRAEKAGSASFDAETELNVNNVFKVSAFNVLWLAKGNKIATVGTATGEASVNLSSTSKIDINKLDTYTVKMEVSAYNKDGKPEEITGVKLTGTNEDNTYFSAPTALVKGENNRYTFTLELNNEAKKLPYYNFGLNFEVTTASGTKTKYRSISWDAAGAPPKSIYLTKDGNKITKDTLSVGADGTKYGVVVEGYKMKPSDELGVGYSDNELTIVRGKAFYNDISTTTEEQITVRLNKALPADESVYLGTYLSYTPEITNDKVKLTVADGTTRSFGGEGINISSKEVAPPETVTKEALKALTDAANAEVKAVQESANGTNIAKDKKWATKTNRDTFLTAIKAAQAVVDNANATQAVIDAAFDALTKARALFATKVSDGTYSGTGGGGGSSSGGSSSGGGTASTPSVDAPSSNVGGSGEVKSEDIKAETSKAVADAVKAAPGATANVTVKNADNITPAALKEMAAAATKAGGKVQLMADSVVNGVIETRLYINPALAATLTAPIKLGVTTNSLEIDATKARFATFANNIAVASFAQQGSFGMKIQVAVKLDLTTLNTKTLVFYSYDKATNTYVPIVAPAYTIDKNGYLHFSTTVGGDIIITDKALVKK